MSKPNQQSPASQAPSVEVSPMAADAAAFRKLITEADALPLSERKAVHHLVNAIGGGTTTVFGFLHELARDIVADAWLSQSDQDQGDSDVEHLRFCAWKRACLLSSLTEIFAAEERAAK